MSFKQEFKVDFAEVASRVKAITDTENTYAVEQPNSRICDINSYSEYGFSMLGKTVGFPAQFVRELYATNAGLATDVINDRVNLYFQKNEAEFFAREFMGKIQGIVSNRYAYFDDNQVIDILENSILSQYKFQNAIISPERLHLRAIDFDNPFKVGNDDSELYFAFFVDNSMVGQSSFKVQLGIFRLACTNGMILPVNQFIICKQVHRGTKDIAAEFNESIAFLSDKKEQIKELLASTTTEKAAIESMREEHRRDYLAKKLNLNAKEAERVITLYSTTYGGNSKWAMINAVTEFARDVKDINRREYLERAAYKAA